MIAAPGAETTGGGTEARCNFGSTNWSKERCVELHSVLEAALPLTSGSIVLPLGYESAC